MKLSQLFTKTRRDAPKDETAKNAQLLIRAGFIHKDAAGVYLWLPLGRIVLNKIIQIIREEMDALGNQEVMMSSLQRKELWEITDRWDDDKVDVWFKTKYKNGTEAGLAWSHEEQMVDMMRQFIASYKDLPIGVYQFQNKLRNEIRAKSGIMRTREFIMKDLYSFCRDQEQHEMFYNGIKEAYLRIFDRVGLGESTYFTFASGGSFAEFSHEFQTVTEAGEDIIYIHKSKRIAINQEVLRDDVLHNLGVKREELEEVKACEVGNIFSFGTSKSEPFGLKFADEDGTEKFVTMGSYGIGPARVMGVIVEHFADERGLVWPASIAPADVHIVRIGDAPEVVAAADELYVDLQAAGKQVIYDDRNERVGQMFADADLIGAPHRVTISSKTIEQGSVEYKARTESDSHLVKTAEAVKTLTEA
jgi:prolyl-tRNA synthetase